MNKDLTGRITVLLINIGTPEKPYKEEIREYLKEFLSDKDVIRLPRLIWLPILYGFVLPFRPKKSARLYQKVWTERGSPLLFNTYNQSRLLQKKLDDYKPGKYHVDVAMRYGKPSISEKLNDIANKGGEKIIIIPLFPQFSTTTTRSIANKVLETCKKDLKSSSLKTKIIKRKLSKIVIFVKKRIILQSIIAILGSTNFQKKFSENMKSKKIKKFCKKG